MAQDRDVLVAVLSYLPATETACAAAVCKQWRLAALAPELWRGWAFARWGSGLPIPATVAHAPAAAAAAAAAAADAAEPSPPPVAPEDAAAAAVFKLWERACRLPHGRFATSGTMVFTASEVAGAAWRVRGWLGLFHREGAVLPTDAHLAPLAAPPLTHSHSHSHPPHVACSDSCAIATAVAADPGVRAFASRVAAAAAAADADGGSEVPVLPPPAGTVCIPVEDSDMITARPPPLQVRLSDAGGRRRGLARLLSATRVPTTGHGRSDSMDGAPPPAHHHSSGAPHVGALPQSYLDLKVVLQHASVEPSAPPLVVLPSDVRVTWKAPHDTAGAVPVLASPAAPGGPIVAAGGLATPPSPPAGGAAARGGGVACLTLHPGASAVLRVAVPVPAGIDHEPEALEALAAVHICLRAAPPPVAGVATLPAVGMLRLDMTPPAAEAGIWRAYRLAPGRRYQRFESDDGGAGAAIGCPYLPGPAAPISRVPAAAPR